MSEFELIERESSSMLDMAREIRVTCDEEYAQAGEFVMGCKALIKKIEEAHAPNIERWHKGHKEAIADRDQHLAPVKRALGIGGEAALTYKREQDRLAKEEADRVERERRRQEEEARLKEAERLEAEGKTAEAEQVIAAPIETPRPTKFISPVPKVAGLSTTGKWKARIVKPRDVKRQFCQPYEAIINQHVASFFAYNSRPTEVQIKELAEEIGGVEIYREEVFAGRIAR